MAQKMLINKGTYFNTAETPAGTPNRFSTQERMKKRRMINMVAYEFYRRIPCGEDRLIGVLPERRTDTTRITHQSIMNWARLLVPEHIFSNQVYFVRVEIKKNSRT